MLLNFLIMGKGEPVQANLLVTGANGTIGKILLKKLSHWNIVGVSRASYDLSDPFWFSQMIDNHKPNILLHCATAGVKPTTDNFDHHAFVNNLQMVNNIIAHADKIDYIFNIGSGAEYGKNYALDSVTEPDIARYKLPTDTYGLSKRLSWQHLQQIVNTTTLRIFGCFDPSEPNFRLLRRFVDHVNIQKPFELTSNRRFSWISGADLAQVVEQLILRVTVDHVSIPKTINVAYKETSAMTLSQILNRWCQLHGKSPLYMKSPALHQPYTCDSSLMYNILTKPLHGLDASLKDYV